MEETLQENGAAIEMEKAVGKLLEDSFNLIEQEPVEALDLEAGCLSCS
jgi:hypothetical protein